METLPMLPEGSQLQYVVGQLERGEESNALHWQFFCYTRKKLTLTKCKSLLVAWIGEHASSTHIEQCRGTLDQNVAYVTKSDTRVGFSFEHGARPVVNRSGRELLAHFRTGGRIDGGDPQWDDVLLRFSVKRLEEMRNFVLPRQRNPTDPCICEVHYGPPGSGKSRTIFEAFPSAYTKPSGKWWDFYDGQTHVLLDDFDGSFLSFNDFKRLVDRYPTKVETKGGVIPLAATHWLITTNVFPSHWWSKKVTGENGRGALWRRITRMVVYESPGPDGELYPGIEWDPAQFRLTQLELEAQDPKGEKHENFQ